jgi:hypothetical protein
MLHCRKAQNGPAEQVQQRRAAAVRHGGDLLRHTPACVASRRAHGNQPPHLQEGMRPNYGGSSAAGGLATSWRRDATGTLGGSENASAKSARASSRRYCLQILLS